MSQTLPETRPEFKKLGTLTKVMTFCLRLMALAFVVISVVGTVGALIYPSYTNVNADISSNGEWALVILESIFGLLSAPAYLITGIALCMFMHRAHTNLNRAGTEGLVHTPGWCVAYWFIPFINLYRPLHAMQELYEASASPRESDWKTADTNTLLSRWWACWLTGSIVGRLESRLLQNEVDLGLGVIPLSWISTIALVLAAVYLIAIVREIQQRQERWDLVN